MLKGLYILGPSDFELIYGPEERRDIARRVDIYAPPQTRESVRQDPGVLAEADVIFSGWGGPRLDEAFLEAAPRLKALFYGAGTVGYMLTPAFWDRGITVTTAIHAN